MSKLVKIIFLVFIVAIIASCGKKQGQAVLASNAAQKVYVAPGEKDEVYAFMSGGFNGHPHSVPPCGGGDHLSGTAVAGRLVQSTRVLLSEPP